jgi:hypothetical protein
MFASLSGPIRDPQEPTLVKLAASIYVHEGTLPWVKKLFGLAVAIQAADAQIKAEGMAELIQAKPAISAHPTSGLRKDLDDMLNFLELGIGPMRNQPSRWKGMDFESALDLLQKPPCLLANGDHESLTAEFPFLDFTSLLEATAKEEHPQLGQGLLLRLTIPPAFSHEEGAKLAIDLNGRELSSLTRTPFLGSWCWCDNSLHFVSFYPNMAYQPGLLPNLILGMTLRAKWIAESVYHDNWKMNYDKAESALAHYLDIIGGSEGDAPAKFIGEPQNRGVKDSATGTQPVQQDEDNEHFSQKGFQEERASTAYSGVLDFSSRLRQMYMQVRKKELNTQNRDECKRELLAFLRDLNDAPDGSELAVMRSALQRDFGAKSSE